VREGKGSQYGLPKMQSVPEAASGLTPTKAGAPMGIELSGGGKPAGGGRKPSSDGSKEIKGQPPLVVFIIRWMVTLVKGRTFVKGRFFVKGRSLGVGDRIYSPAQTPIAPSFWIACLIGES
jgi:hypothetical protein